MNRSISVGVCFVAVEKWPLVVRLTRLTIDRRGRELHSAAESCTARPRASRRGREFHSAAESFAARPRGGGRKVAALSFSSLTVTGLVGGSDKIATDCETSRFDCAINQIAIRLQTTMNAHGCTKECVTCANCVFTVYIFIHDRPWGSYDTS